MSKPKPKRKGDALMSQMGIFGLDQKEDMEADQEDLMAELLTLQSGASGSPKSVKPKKKTVPNVRQIEQMAASITTSFDSDEDISGDENDFMKELEELSSDEEEKMEVQPKPAKDPRTLLSLVESRLLLYQQAAANADGAKKRRCERGVKTLQGQLRSLKAGRPIDEDEIPPDLTVDKKITNTEPPVTQAKPVHQPESRVAASVLHPTPTIPATAEPIPVKPTVVTTPEAQGDASEDAHPQLPMLMDRRNQYHAAATEAHARGDQDTARKYLRIRKDFDRVLEAVKQGQDVDLSNIPPPPNRTPSSRQALPTRPTPTQLVPQAGPHVAEAAVAQASNQGLANAAEGASYLDNVPEPSKEENKKLFAAPEPPRTLLEALEQRMMKYRECESEASEQGNSSKARRNGRIVKQYMDAIKSHKTGKQFEYTELPVPPGYPSFPMPGSTPAPAPPTAITTPAAVVIPTASLAPPAQATTRSRSPSPSVQPAQAISMHPTAPQAASPPDVKPKPKRHASLSIQDKQMEQLLTRQAQYKKAALQAKTSGDKELAVKYMRVIRGINPMITAAQNGLPVEMSQIPPAPTSEHETGYVIVDKSEVADITPEERHEEFEKVRQQLVDQIQKARLNAKNFTEMGDVKQATRFETEELNCKKDLDVLKNAYSHGDPVPKYHYEARQYSTVIMNSDLGTGDMEVSIIRGVQYPLPPECKTAKDLDTHVVFELPFPQDMPQRCQTEWSKHSDQPEYNFITKLKIERQSKSMRRIFSNRKLKFEILYKRGFLKSDKLLSVVNVKLDVLDSKAIHHDSFNLLDTNGRREIGGKLEIKLRLREPLSQKQVEVIHEKWLVIDQFVRVSKPIHKQPAPPNVLNTGPPLKMGSVEVLKFEKKELDAQIRQRASQLSKNDLDKLTSMSANLASQIDGITSAMRNGQLPPHEYVQALKGLMQSYAEAQQNAQRAGDRRKCDMYKIKRELITQEVKAWQSKISLQGQ